MEDQATYHTKVRSRKQMTAEDKLILSLYDQIDSMQRQIEELRLALYNIKVYEGQAAD